MPSSPAHALALAGALLAAGAVAAAPDAGAASALLYEGDSAYSHVTVRDEGGKRCLWLGRNQDRGAGEGGSTALQSCVVPGRPDEHVFEYSTLMFAGLALQPAPRRALLVGLGGGVIAQAFVRHLEAVKLDVVEVDPKVVEACRRWFELPEAPSLQVITRDGRVFVRSAAGRYDLILLDAFLADYIPFHLTTAEFLRQVRAALAPGGAVVANVHADNALFDAELRTWEEVFPGEVQVFRGARSQNASIAAAPGVQRRPLEALLARVAASEAAKALPFDVAAEVRKLDPAARPAEGAPVLTDDRAPVHSLQRQPRGR